MEVKIRDIRKYEEAKARFKHLYRRSGTDIDIIERLRYAKILDEVPGNAGRILDLGCGDGYLSLKCAANPEAEVYSIDISINQLYKFKSRIHSGNIIQIQGSVEHLPFKYDKFDLIIASEIIEHLYDYKTFFEQMYYILKDSGILLLTVPYNEPVRVVICPHCYKPLNPEGHIHSFDEETIKKVSFQYGYKILKIRIINNILTRYLYRKTHLPLILLKFFDNLFSALFKSSSKYLLCKLKKVNK